MTLEEIKRYNIRNGKYSHLEYVKNIPTLRGYKEDIVQKHTKCVVRFGIYYGRFKDNEVIEAGPHTKPFGDFIIRNVVSNKNEKNYLWCYFTNNHKHTFKSYYTLNGKEVDIQYLLDNKICSESGLGLKNQNDSPMFVVNIDNVISLGAR